MLTLGELAAYLAGLQDAEGSLQGAEGSSLQGADPSVELHAIAPLERAGPRDAVFLWDRRYLPALRDAKAGCVVLRREWAAHSPAPVICVPNPYLAYAWASKLFDTRPPTAAGVHPSATLAPSARIPASASVGPGACLAADARLGEDVVIGAGCYVGEGVRIGRGTRLEPHVVLYHGVSIGEDCRVHAATVIGADGFGFAPRPGGGWQKIYQLGAVRIGDRVDIGASVTIDRGALDDTVIEDDVIIDDQVHIAHNCVIGARTAIAGCTGLAGSTRVGADCTFAGQVGVSGHLQICDNAHFAGQARITKSVPLPGRYASGTPLQPTREWARSAVRFTELEALQRRVLGLENALESAGESVPEKTRDTARRGAYTPERKPQRPPARAGDASTEKHSSGD